MISPGSVWSYSLLPENQNAPVFQPACDATNGTLILNCSHAFRAGQPGNSRSILWHRSSRTSCPLPPVTSQVPPTDPATYSPNGQARMDRVKRETWVHDSSIVNHTLWRENLGDQFVTRLPVRDGSLEPLRDAYLREGPDAKHPCSGSTV